MTDAEDSAGLFERLRRDLDAEQHKLESEIADLDTDIAPGSLNDNLADGAQVTAEVTETRTLSGALRERLDDVEHALVRLDEGTYGTCEVCGTVIPTERLEALPTARWCMEHAS